jgi:hypothetical protein
MGKVGVPQKYPGIHAFRQPLQTLPTDSDWARRRLNRKANKDTRKCIHMIPRPGPIGLDTHEQCRPSLGRLGAAQGDAH